MANPTRYQQAYSFTSWQATNPARPLPGQRVDIELQALQLTTDEIITGLNQIRRADGKLFNGVVDLAALSDEVIQQLGGGGGPGNVILATKAQAEAGTSNAVVMSPLRVKEAIDVFAGSGGGAQGPKGDKGDQGPPGPKGEPGIPGDGSNIGYTPEDVANKGQPNGYASLGPDGKVPTDQLPPIASPSPTGHVWRVSEYLQGATGDNRAALLQLAEEVRAAGGGRVIIDRPIELSGPWRFENCQDVILEAEGAGSIFYYRSANPGAAAIRFIASTRILIQRIRVFSTVSREENIGFFSDCHNSTHITVRECIAENLLTGPWFGYCQHVLVENCQVLTPRRDGIHFALGCLDCTAIGNFVFDAQDDGLASTTDFGDQGTIGLTYRRTQRIKFIGNTVHGGQGRGGSGVIAYDSDQVHIIGNTTRDTACSGVVISRHIDGQPYCRSNIVADNIVINPGRQPGVDASAYMLGCGVFLANVEDTLVANNIVRDVTANPSLNKGGIVGQYLRRVTVRGNKVYNVNGLGLGAEGPVEDCNFIGNEFDLITGSGIGFAEMAVGFQGSFVEISDNRTRRCATARGFPMNLNLSTAGGVIVARNTDAQGKKSSISAPAGSFLIDNFPILWMPFTPNFQEAQGTISKSGEVGRYAFEGSSVIIEAQATLSYSAPGGGLYMNLPYAPDNTIALIDGWNEGDNIPYIGRHRDSFPGTVSFTAPTSANAGAQAPRTNGRFKVSGRYVPRLA